MLIFEFINVFIETVIILFYCGNIFEAKHSLSNGAKIATIFGLLGILTFTGFLHLGTYINLALSYCACFIVSCIMYEGELQTKLFISAIYIVTIILADILATVIITFFDISYGMVGGDNISYITGAMMSDFIRLWLLAYVGKILSRRINSLPVSYWIFLFACPILSVTCLIIFDIYLMQAEKVNNVLVCIPWFCILYINFMLFRFFDNFSEQIRLKVVEELAKSTEENYITLQKSTAELRKVKHDLSNHIISIKAYVEDGKKDECLQYLDSLTDYANINSDIIDTGNSVIDAILTAKRNLARERNIDFSADIQIPENLKINSSDCCVIFGNALDNAIEACDKVQGDKYINVSLIYQNGSLMCKIANSMNEAKNPLLKTTKADKINHGIGLKNIRETLNKYSSMLRVEQNSGEFVLSFIIYEIN